MTQYTMAIEVGTGRKITLAADGGVWVGQDFYPAGVTPTVGEVEAAGDDMDGGVIEDYRAVLVRLGRR